MDKKKILSVLIISLIVLGSVLFVVKNLNAEGCSASYSCSNGSTIWCSAFGEDASCYAANGMVTCTGGGITKSWMCPPAM